MKTILRIESPIPLSIAEIEPGEEVFLTMQVRQDGDYGAGIERTGDRPPTVAWPDPPHRITDPHAQRRGSWFIWRGDKLRDDAVTKERLSRATDPFLREDLEAMQADVEEDACHSIRFRGLFPGWKIKGMQGCGDLTMNYWKVTYLNNHLIAGRHFVCLRGEDAASRIYTCIVKWKRRLGARPLFSIEELRFSRIEGTNVTAEVWRDGRWLDRSEEIEFAISNPRTIRDGEVVSAIETCEQFGDIRHLVQTPNLNPPGPLFPAEPPKPGGAFLPRRFFDQDQSDAIWLGEKQIADDWSRNLLRAALSGPVVLGWPIGGASERQIRGALALSRYSEALGTNRLLRQGEWRFRREREKISGLEIHFRRNCYGWTMLGIGADGRKIMLFACKGYPANRLGYTLEQAAAIFRNAGAAEALLIDEGDDTFQIVDGEDRVPRPNRRRLRACLAVGEREGGQGE